MDIQMRVSELSLQGYCCSQIVMQMGLDSLKRENPDIIKAMAGLCNGMQTGQVCGILSAGACLLALVEPKKAAAFMVNDMVQWFTSEYGGGSCSVKCTDILCGREHDKYLICPEMVENTFLKINEIFFENGIDFDDF